jgi:hypothetical protein
MPPSFSKKFEQKKIINWTWREIFTFLTDDSYERVEFVSSNCFLMLSETSKVVKLE